MQLASLYYLEDYLIQELYTSFSTDRINKAYQDCFCSRFFYASGESEIVQVFKDHFRFVSLPFNHEVLFLDQVHGVKPGNTSDSHFNLNKLDGCFQCSLSGPDVILLPFDAMGLVKEGCPTLLP